MPVFPPAAVSLPVTEILLELHATPAEQALIVIAPKETTVAAATLVPVTAIELPVIKPVAVTAAPLAPVPWLMPVMVAELLFEVMTAFVASADTVDVDAEFLA